MLSTLVRPNCRVKPMAPIAISAAVTTPNPSAWTISNAAPHRHSLSELSIGIERLHVGLADRPDHLGRRVGGKLLDRLRAERVVVLVEQQRAGGAHVLDLVPRAQGSP